MPSIPGVPVVDIGGPNFRFSPPAGVPTVRRPAPANRPREAW
jgi:hypothetical protein